MGAMSSAHKTTDDRWQAALAQDDLDEAQEHFSGKVRELQDVRLAQALAHDPLPVNILGGMVTEGLFHTHWIERVMDVGLKTDWKRALEWRAARADGPQVDRELREAVHSCMNQYVSLSGTGRGRLALERALTGLFDFRPDLAKQVDASGSVHYSYFFRLSARDDGGDWLARSGLDIDKVLLETISCGRHTELLSPHKPEELPGDRLNAWLDRAPEYRQAWDKLDDSDQARIRQEEDWYVQWLPEGQWKGSPLEAWCEAGTEQRQSLPSPLDHPALRHLDGSQANHDIEACAKDYGLGLGYENPESMRVRARRMNNIFRARTSGQVLLDCPLDTLTMGLRHRHMWAALAICEEEGARKIQAMMLKDRRAIEAADSWGVREVAEWTVKQPLWHTWRSRDGNSLLGEVVERYNASNRAKPSLPKFLVIKLARKAPDLLCHRGSSGARLLDQLDIPPGTKAEADRIMLGRTIEIPRKRVRTPGRSM